MTAPMHHVLVVEDEQSIRDILEELFTVEGNQVVAVGNLDEAERRAIASALRGTGGNKARAAQLLGIARSTLQEKVKKLGID